MERLRARSDFLAAARGRRVNRPAFVLQALARQGDGGAARFGFTVTRKTGNAVVRNRIRRRLREAVRLNGLAHAQPGTDYVLVGRREALQQPFERLSADLIGAFRAARGKAPPADATAPAKARYPDGE